MICVVIDMMSYEGVMWGMRLVHGRGMRHMHGRGMRRAYNLYQPVSVAVILYAKDESGTRQILATRVGFCVVRDGKYNKLQ